MKETEANQTKKTITSNGINENGRILSQKQNKYVLNNFFSTDETECLLKFTCCQNCANK